jgi:hypothetical protein
MIRYLLGLIFGGTVLVTPAPVNIVDHLLLSIAPVSSIDGHGNLQIDVSAQIPAASGVFRSHARGLAAFPPDCVRATLLQSGGSSSVKLVYAGKMVFTDSGLRLLLESPDGIPPGIKFDRVEISASVPLRSVKVYWRNYSEK